MAGRVVAIGARTRGSAFRAGHGNGNPVIVGDAGDDKLAPITERAGAKVGGGHLATIAEPVTIATGSVHRVQIAGAERGTLAGHSAPESGNKRENAGITNPMMRLR